MCGRYTLSEMPEWSELGVRVPDELLLRPRYNAAPGQLQLIVRGVGAPAGEPGLESLELAELRWGARGPEGRSLINARREKLGGAFWRRAQERCVIPADGYVEWAKGEGGKQPIWLRPTRGSRLYFAGLLMDEGFVVVTAPASDDVRHIHDRMPSLLPARAVRRWIEGEISAPSPPAGILRATPISRAINDARRDEPSSLSTSDDGLAPPWNRMRRGRRLESEYDAQSKRHPHEPVVSPVAHRGAHEERGLGAHAIVAVQGDRDTQARAEPDEPSASEVEVDVADEAL